MLINPWLLASAVFGIIGLLDETKKTDDKKPKALPKSEAKPGGDTHVNVTVPGSTVQSKKEPKAKAKPSAKVPAEPSGDG